MNIIGSFSSSFSNGHRRLIVEWLETSQSTSNNTTTLKVTAFLEVDSSYSISSSASKSISLTINGISYSGSCSVSISGGQKKELFSHTVTIAHNNDGNKSVGISASLGLNVSFSSGYVGTVTASGTATLTNIPRSSSFYSADNVNVGSTVSLSWYPASSSYGFRIHLTVHGNNGNFDIGIGGNGTGVNSGYIYPGTTGLYRYTGYTLSLNEIAPYITNSKTARCTATLYTYSNGSQVGSPHSMDFTVTIPDSTSPFFSNPNYSPNKNNSIGVYLQNKSYISFNCPCVGQYGASIVSRIYSVGNASISSNSESCACTISDYGDIEIYCSATDSRGYTTKRYMGTLVGVNPYFAPYFTNPTVCRNKDNYEQLKVTPSVSFSSVSGSNKVSVYLKYKEKNASSWNETTVVEEAASTLEYTISGVTFDEAKVYDLYFRVIDSVGSEVNSAVLSISTREVLLDFYAGGKGLGIGKMCEGDGLDIALETQFRENLTFDDNAALSLFNVMYPIGSIYLKYSSGAPPYGSWASLGSGYFTDGSGRIHTHVYIYRRSG